MQLCCFDKHGGGRSAALPGFLSDSSDFYLKQGCIVYISAIMLNGCLSGKKMLPFNTSIKHNLRCSPPSSCVGWSVLRPRCYRAAESIEAPASTWSPCLHVQREFFCGCNRSTSEPCTQIRKQKQKRCKKRSRI